MDDIKVKRTDSDVAEIGFKNPMRIKIGNVVLTINAEVDTTCELKVDQPKED